MTSQRLFVLRHGESVANVDGRICSGPATGLLATEGLTDQGRDEVRQSALRFLDEVVSQQAALDVLILSSDFTRTRETAETFLAVLQDSGRVHVSLELTSLLRERHFGDHEGSSNKKYPLIWANDSQELLVDNVETPLDVAARALSAVERARASSKAVCILVSHGDTLQIMLTALQGKSPWCHRQLSHLNTAEWREIV